MFPMLTEQVDAIITDLPYGTTACEWDTVIPFAPMWKEIKRLLKKRGAFVTTASQPFTSALVMSNADWFKYCWYWRKEQGTGFARAKVEPMQVIEEVAVFGGSGILYIPQMKDRQKPVKFYSSFRKDSKSSPMQNREKYVRVSNTAYPVSVIDFQRDRKTGIRGLHPTQKPVALYEYLIRTYTNPGDTVLDFVMGSGTTGVAAINTGRNFIGIEKEPKYFDIAKRRTEEAQAQLSLELITL